MLCMSSSCQTTTPNETHSRIVDTSYTMDDVYSKILDRLDKLFLKE